MQARTPAEKIDALIALRAKVDTEIRRLRATSVYPMPKRTTATERRAAWRHLMAWSLTPEFHHRLRLYGGPSDETQQLEREAS